MKSTKKIIITLLVLIAFTFTSNVSAGNNGRGNADKEKTGSDRGDHGDGTGNQGSNGKQVGNTRTKKNQSIPLDGGLSILLLGAAAFGVKKLRQK